ncbi:MAG: LytTR family DNA-binding domain-containing protein, partial [Bacteroidota bacterium]
NIRFLLVSVFVGLFIGLFLIAFQPFDINLMDIPFKQLKVFGFGLITTITMLFYFWLLPRIFSFLFQEDRWQVIHQIGYIFLTLLTIATLNGLYINYLNGYAFSWQNYAWIVQRTLLLGGIPITFITMLDHQRKLNQHLKAAEGFSSEVHQHQKRLSKDLVNQKIFLDIPHVQIWGIQAQGNYIAIWMLEAGVPKRKLERMALSQCLEHFAESEIMQCHRSWLVNISHVSAVKGNAQGLKLHTKQGEPVIPVSRRFIAQVRGHLANRKTVN